MPYILRHGEVRDLTDRPIRGRLIGVVDRDPPLAVVQFGTVRLVMRFDQFTEWSPDAEAA